MHNTINGNAELPLINNLFEIIVIKRCMDYGQSCSPCKHRIVLVIDFQTSNKQVLADSVFLIHKCI